MSKSIEDILKDDKKFTEMARIAFESVDTNKSGQFDVSELYNVIVQIATDFGADSPAKEDVNGLLDHIDSDRSCGISFDKFKVLLRDILECMLENY
jgi:Ca2+-binding EF-hand superfamily protein